MTMWVKGLNWLVADTLKSPTPLQIERWTKCIKLHIPVSYSDMHCTMSTTHVTQFHNILSIFFNPGGYVNNSMQSIVTEKTGESAWFKVATLSLSLKFKSKLLVNVSERIFGGNWLATHISTSSCSRKRTAEDGGYVQMCVFFYIPDKSTSICYAALSPLKFLW